MTPFDAWFDANIRPALPGVPPEAIKIVRAPLVAGWNAALEELFTPHVGIDVSDIDAPIALKAEIFQRVWKACVDRVQQRRVTP